MVACSTGTAAPGNAGTECQTVRARERREWRAVPNEGRRAGVYPVRGNSGHVWSTSAPDLVGRLLAQKQLGSCCTRTRHEPRCRLEEIADQGQGYGVSEGEERRAQWR